MKILDFRTETFKTFTTWSRDFEKVDTFYIKMLRFIKLKQLFESQRVKVDGNRRMRSFKAADLQRLQSDSSINGFNSLLTLYYQIINDFNCLLTVY